MKDLKQEAWHESGCHASRIETPADKELEVCGCLYGWAMEAIDKAYKAGGADDKERNKVTGETSDGYHTFNELYEFRKIYNAVLFNEWYRLDKYQIHKSKKHFDGEECFGGGWFIVMATLPTGQISNHYELKDWDLFRCVARDKADKWDGHTAQDVCERLKAIKNIN